MSLASLCIFPACNCSSLHQKTFKHTKLVIIISLAGVWLHWHRPTYLKQRGLEWKSQQHIHHVTPALSLCLPPQKISLARIQSRSSCQKRNSSRRAKTERGQLKTDLETFSVLSLCYWTILINQILFCRRQVETKSRNIRGNPFLFSSTSVTHY